MPLTSVQKTAVDEVVNAVLSVTAARGKRQLCAIFMDLVDREEWPQYYEVIPEPRCLNNIRLGVEKGRYKDASDVYTDLSLVFWNALFYNEPGSQISQDAELLKGVLETEWKKRSVLPIPRTSPPPSSAQKVHKANLEVDDKSQHVAATVPITSTTPSVPTPASTSLRVEPVPVTQILAQPTAGNNSSFAKPVPIRPKSAQRQPTPDMDVDVISSDGQAGDDAAGSGAERDPESEEIIKQLEKGLPRWPGFGDGGWMEEVALDRLLEIVHTIKSHKDILGYRLAIALESVPEESTVANLSYTYPLSLKLIENRVQTKAFNTSKDFDIEMARLFEKARRWHEPGSESYGRVLLLQRLYHALTSSTPPPGPPYVSSTNFASLRAGPGSTKPVHGSEGEGIAGVTTHRVLTKDRTFVDEVKYKGWTVKLADWLHLSNPDDPSRPIIAQVFRCWVSDEFSKKGLPGITVSWYYRPEQTFHSSNRKFWEGEVFKTSHFAEHPLADIIEKIACQFTARHTRGRPRPPYWYRGWPLYVCDSRYNDRERVFVKIKNWNSCVPEEVRKSVEFMPIYPFERTVYPRRVRSPFLTGRGAPKGPGGIIQGDFGAEEEGPDGSRKRPRKNAPGDRVLGRGTGLTQLQPQPSPQHLPAVSTQLHRNLGPDRSVITAAGGAAVLGGNAQVEKLPSETTKHFDRDPDTNEVLWFAAPPVNVARGPKARHSFEYLHYLSTQRKRTRGGGGSDNDNTVQTIKPTVSQMIRQALTNLHDEI